MSGFEAASLYALQAESELAKPGIEVPEPAFDGRKFSLEIPPTMDQRLFINEFHRGVLRYAQTIGVNLQRRLPGMAFYHFFPDSEHMYRNLEALDFSIYGDEVGFYSPDGRWLAISNTGNVQRVKSTIGHETIHSLQKKGWRLARSRILTESLVDLATGEFMRNWCSPSRARDFEPGFKGLGLVTDELVRKSAAVLNIAPNRIFGGLMIDLFTGREQQLAERILKRILDEEGLQHIREADIYFEYVDDIFDLADKLDLPDVYRRYREVLSKSAGQLVLSKWIAREDIPEPALPLSEAERREMQGEEEETEPTSTEELFEVPEEIVYRPPPTTSPQASSTLMEIRDTLQATVSELVDAKEDHLAQARYIVDGIISQLHAVRTECQMLIREHEAKLRDLERKLQEMAIANDTPHTVNPQTQYDSLKAATARLHALALTMDSAIDAAAGDRERLEYSSALVDTAVDITAAYESNL